MLHRTLFVLSVLVCFVGTMASIRAVDAQTNQCCKCGDMANNMWFTPSSGHCNAAVCQAPYAWGPVNCPVQQGIPGPVAAPGNTIGSIAAGIGGPDESSRCEVHTAYFGPMPLKAVAGKPVEITFTWGRLGGGMCHQHSGGQVEWGDQTPASALPTESAGPPCSTPQNHRLGTRSAQFTHVYQTPGRYVVTGWAQGDFKNQGSYRCRNQRQDWIEVSPF